MNILSTTTFNYTGTVQEIQIPKGVHYMKIEAWGASGGNSMCNGSQWDGGGKGGYIIGYYKIPLDVTKLYIYVGGAGSNGGYKTAPGGWNGGGYGTYDGRDDEGAGGGGGATDIRTVKAGTKDTDWYNSDHTSWENDISLLSRIAVAAGGGGASWYCYGGNGGGLEGAASNSIVTGGSQTSGYAFGKGQDGYGAGASNGVAGSGSGWFGGNSYNGNGDYLDAGSGGSSYITLLEKGVTETGKNKGNGKAIITFLDRDIYILSKDNKYYIPSSDFFNADKKEFIEPTKEEILNFCTPNGIKDINFEIGSKHLSDYINLNSYKLCIISKSEIEKINVYKKITKSEIKIHYDNDILLNGYSVDVEDKNLPYKINGKDVYIYLDAINSNLKKIIYYTKNIKSNLLDVNEYIKDNKRYIKFYNSYKNVVINKTYKQECKYVKDTLDKF